MKSLGFEPNQPPITFTADCGRFYANVSSMELTTSAIRQVA